MHVTNDEGSTPQLTLPATEAVTKTGAARAVNTRMLATSKLAVLTTKPSFARTCASKVAFPPILASRCTKSHIARRPRPSTIAYAQARRRTLAVQTVAAHGRLAIIGVAREPRVRATVGSKELRQSAAVILGKAGFPRAGTVCSVCGDSVRRAADAARWLHDVAVD